MKIFMLGWEFPPHISGGLGTASYGITKALTNLGVDVDFVLPRPITKPYIQERMEELAIPSIEIEQSEPSARISHLSPQAPPSTVASSKSTAGYNKPKLRGVTFHTVDVLLAPYLNAEEYEGRLREHQPEIKVQATQEGPDATAPHILTAEENEERLIQQQAVLKAQAEELGSSTIKNQKSKIKNSTITRTIMSGTQYSGDLVQETQRYATFAAAVGRDQNFDVIHAHDWMTFPAGIAVAAARKRPLVVHVHSTEVDRGGQHPNQQIFEIEKHGMQAAAKVIAVSEYTKRLIIDAYDIAPEKIAVVHNGIETSQPVSPRQLHVTKDEKVVLFLGRITAQKGPEYFLAAARKVIDVYPDVKFVMAGTGDMIHQTIEMAAALGIGHKVFFTGFLHGADVQRIFNMADLFVMPSISEPFGIAPLEAISHDVPVIISKQSGVAEVLDHVLKVDFWDTDELANKIIAVLRHPSLSATLRERGTLEIAQLTWNETAQKIRDIYTALLAKPAAKPAAPSSPPPVVSRSVRFTRPEMPHSRRVTPAKKKTVPVIKAPLIPAQKPSKSNAAKNSPALVKMAPKPAASKKPKPVAKKKIVKSAKKRKKSAAKKSPAPAAKKRLPAKPKKSSPRPTSKKAKPPKKKPIAKKSSSPAKRKPSVKKDRKKK